MSNGRFSSQIKNHPFKPQGGELKRKVTIATAIAMLFAASAAYAALNTYGASFAFSGKAGSVKAPAPIGYHLTLKAANAVSTSRAAPLINLDIKIYGLISHGANFPTCSAATIQKVPGYNANCPKGSLVATGLVNSFVGGPDLTKPGSPCNPHLTVYNGGKNRQWFFFSVPKPTDCAGLKTGGAAPWEGFISQHGKYMEENIPLPPDISTRASNINDLYGSLIQENITYPRISKRVKGKTVAYQASVGCLKGHRPWSVKFTATNGSGTTESHVVTGTSGC